MQIFIKEANVVNKKNRSDCSSDLLNYGSDRGILCVILLLLFQQPRNTFISNYICG